MDDFAWHNAVHLTAEDRNRAILDVLGAQRAKAALFVVRLRTLKRNAASRC